MHLNFIFFLTETLALFQQILHTAKTAALLGRLLLDLRGVAQHNELNTRLIKALRGICSYWEYNTIIGFISIW